MFLKYRKFLSLLLILLLLAPVVSVRADAAETGAITHYNGVIFGDMTALQADTEGALAVMGNASFGSSGNGYDIGGAHSGVHMGDYAHIGLYSNEHGYPSFLLGGTLTINGHRTGVEHGITLMKESNRQASQTALGLLECLEGVEFTTDRVIDGFFASARQTVDNTSSGFLRAGVESATVSQLRSFSSQDLSRFANHTITGSGLDILVVNVDETGTFLSESIYLPDLSGYDLLIINIPAETVNFTGGAIYYKGSVVLTEPRAYESNAVTTELAAKIVWNLPNATEVNTTGYDIFGSVLAPKAAVTGSGGSINGLLVAKTFRQTNSMELHAFRLTIGEKIWELVPEEPEEPGPDPDEPVDPEKSVAEGSAAGQDGSTVEVGDFVTYEITYYNHEVDTADVTVTDWLDPDVIYRGSSHDGEYDDQEHKVTWLIEDASPKRAGSVTLTVEVAASALLDEHGDPLAEPEVENDACVQIGNNTEQKTDKVTNPLEPEDPKNPGPGPEGPDPEDPSKSIAKDSPSGQGGSAVKVGDIIIYEITYYHNAGSEDGGELPDGEDTEGEGEDAEGEDADDEAAGEALTELQSANPETGEILTDAASEQETTLPGKLPGDEETSLPSETSSEEEGPLPGEPSHREEITNQNRASVPGAEANAALLSDPEAAQWKTFSDDLAGPPSQTELSNEDTTSVAKITIRDALEDGLDFVEASHDGAYDEKSRTVTWIIEDVEEECGGSVFLTVKVNEKALKRVENFACVQIGNDPEQETNKVENPLDEEEEDTGGGGGKNRRRSNDSTQEPDPEPEPDDEEEDEEDPVEEIEEEDEEKNEDVTSELDEEDPSLPHDPSPIPSDSSRQKENPKTGVVQACFLPALMLLFLYGAILLNRRNRK